MTTITDHLDRYFFEVSINDDDCTELVQSLALDEEELQVKFQDKELSFRYGYNIKENVMVNQEESNSEEDSEPEPRINFTPVKEEAETSAVGAKRKKNNPQRTYDFESKDSLKTKDIPSGTINIDDIPNRNERRQIIDRWSTGLSLIIGASPDEYLTANNVLLLAEHKA